MYYTQCISSGNVVVINVRNNCEMFHMGIDVKYFAVYNIIHKAEAQLLLACELDCIIW